MPRQRMIKPDFFESESLSECSIAARLCFVGLWVMGDDFGNQKLNLKRLKRQIFPDDDMTLEEFKSLLSDLEKVGCIQIYEINSEVYLTVPNFNVYQTVKKPSKTNIPKPDQSSIINGYFDNGEVVDHQLPTSDHLEITSGENTTKANEISVENHVENYEYPTSDPLATLKKERSKEELFIPKEINNSSTASENFSDAQIGKICGLCGSSVKETGTPSFYSCPICGLIKAKSVEVLNVCA